MNSTIIAVWSLMAEFGRLWPNMVTCGRTWSHVAEHAPMCFFLVKITFIPLTGTGCPQYATQIFTIAPDNRNHGVSSSSSLLQDHHCDLSGVVPRRCTYPYVLYRLYDDVTTAMHKEWCGRKC